MTSPSSFFGLPVGDVEWSVTSNLPGLSHLLKLLRQLTSFPDRAASSTQMATAVLPRRSLFHFCRCGKNSWQSVASRRKGLFWLTVHCKNLIAAAASSRQLATLHPQSRTERRKCIRSCCSLLRLLSAVGSLYCCTAQGPAQETSPLPFRVGSPTPINSIKTTFHSQQDLDKPS